MKSAPHGAPAIALTTPPSSDVLVEFSDSAPTDRFTILHAGAYPLEEVKVTLEPKASVAGVIFDVAEASVGVFVYRPFEIVSGHQFLHPGPVVRNAHTRAAS